ncbi:MAG: GAF domain-containing protein [Bacteroidales bacterium]|nr:GAF domain-containing protein [Bacteroidales bacterium]
MNKTQKYEGLLKKVRSLIEGETDIVAKMATVAAAVHEEMGFFWTGFYRAENGELLIGPFQGPAACIHIPFGKGVCGTSYVQARTIVVPDVEEFPGHIACSSLSRSEIVVPVIKDGRVIAVLDIDSKELATFDEVDARYLEQIVSFISSSGGEDLSNSYDAWM